MDTQGYTNYRTSYKYRYYNKADFIILVYDISNRLSYEECKSYYKNSIEQKCKNNNNIILLGNKIDLEDKREVFFDEAKEFANLNNYLFMEASCLKNKNIKKPFEKIIELVLLAHLKKYKSCNLSKYLKY